MATGLNNFFVEKVKKMVDELPPQTEDLLAKLIKQQPLNIPQQQLKEIRMSDLDNLMNKVKRTPAAGVDSISLYHGMHTMACHRETWWGD